MDEVLWHRGHKYLTVVYQIDEHCKRLLWIGTDRTTCCFMRFWSWLGEERAQGLQYICSDMWKPYLKVIAYKSKKKGMNMMHLLDRFHIAKNMNMAIDKVRATESKELAA
ncbi:MAG: transposase, partial [Myxococcales bacterium]|nr:transposase [Myxococcales bacterium]